MKPIDFENTAAALKAGDRQAWRELMGRFYGWSVALTKKIVRDPEQAANVALDFWERLPVDIRAYNPGQGSLYTWMTRCLTNRAINSARKKRVAVSYRRETPEEDHAVTTPESQLSALQDIDAIAARLPPLLQQVFWRLLEGATEAELADELGIAPKRVGRLIGQVRRVIRDA